jgi:hypothetical protein
VHDNQGLWYGMLGVRRLGAPLVTPTHHPISVDRRQPVRPRQRPPADRNRGTRRRGLMDKEDGARRKDTGSPPASPLNQARTPRASLPVEVLTRNRQEILRPTYAKRRHGSHPRAHKAAPRASPPRPAPCHVNINPASCTCGKGRVRRSPTNPPRQWRAKRATDPSQATAGATPPPAPPQARPRPPPWPARPPPLRPASPPTGLSQPPNTDKSLGQRHRVPVRRSQGRVSNPDKENRTPMPIHVSNRHRTVTHQTFE